MLRSIYIFHLRNISRTVDDVRVLHFQVAKKFYTNDIQNCIGKVIRR
jgi:hypothetical protein